MNIEGFVKKDSFEEKINSHINETISYYPKNLNQEFYKEIENLKNKILKIKKGEIEKNNLTQIKYDLQKQSPYFLDERKDKKYISIGDIEANIIWQENYYLSYDSFNEDKDVGGELYSKYLENYTKTETLKILNKYIYENEIIVNNTKDNFKKNAYEQSLKESNKEIHEMRSGILAEKLVRSFLTKIFANQKDLDIQIEEVNIYQDIENKIDFLIKTKTHKRGVGVETDEIDEEKIRKIQFTINDSFKSNEIKNKQLENLSDVILVKIPELEVNQIIKTWQNKKEKHISPDRYIKNETKVEIIEKILKDFIEEEMLDKIKKSAII